MERELARVRVRLDVERLDAEKANIGRRVSYAPIGVTITEERKAGLDAGPLSLTTRIRIAAADGLESAFESVAMMLLFVLRAVRPCCSGARLSPRSGSFSDAECDPG